MFLERQKNKGYSTFIFFVNIVFVFRTNTYIEWKLLW